MVRLSEQDIIEQVAGRLVASFTNATPAEVNRIVLEEYARFAGRPVREFIPLLVERNAKAELSRLAAADRTTSGTAC